MSRCTSCGHENEPGNAFCLNCGAALVETQATGLQDAPGKGISPLARVERGVYFSIARAVAWVLAIVTLLSMVYSGIHLVPAAARVRAKADTVSASDLSAAVAAARSGRQLPAQMESDDESYSARDLAQLDQAIYELIQLAPKDAVQQYGGTDVMRTRIKNELRELDLPDLDDQIGAVKDAQEAVAGVLEADRPIAIQLYFGMTNQRNVAAKSRALAGKAELTTWMVGFGSSAITLMMVTMILVMMAIESNTRR